MLRIFSLIVIVSAACLTSCAKVVRGWQSESQGEPTVTVDSIDFRKDLTRVYCHISGRPHTSNRIDRVSMTVNGRLLECSDIDGVDFNRYFQWEDDGTIPLELDFGPVKKASQGELRLTTPRGETLTKWWSVTKTAKKGGRK